MIKNKIEAKMKSLPILALNSRLALKRLWMIEHSKSLCEVFFFEWEEGLEKFRI